MSGFNDQWLVAAVFGSTGLAFGWAYFTALRKTVGRFAEGHGWRAAGLTLARIAGAILFFGAAARFGALPLLMAFIGFLIARTLALRAARRNA